MSNGPDENEKPRSTQDIKSIRQNKLKTFMRTGLMIFFEIGLPIALYYILKNYIKEIWALFISSTPPLIIVVCGIIRNRRIDILGVMLILSNVVSAIVASVRNDARLHLLRESAVTGTTGLAFVITLIPIKIGSFRMRPIVFYFARDMATGGTFGYASSRNQLPGLTEDEPIAERWDRYWNSYSMFRRGFIVLTAVWGFGLLSEVPIRAIVVFKSKSVEQAFLLTNVISYSWLGLLILFNIFYARRMQKNGEKAAAAAAAANDDDNDGTTYTVDTADNSTSEQTII